MRFVAVSDIDTQSEKFPALGHAARVELHGTDGAMLLDDDHTDQVTPSDASMPHVYLPDTARMT